MFMNTSGRPPACAAARSWCTGVKSREAMAPPTIRLDVIGISSGGSLSPTLTALYATVVLLLMSVSRNQGGGSDRIKLGQHGFRVHLLHAAFHFHADVHILGLAADDVRHDPRALGKADNGTDQRVRITGELRVVHFDKAEHFTVEGRFDVIPFDRLALAAHGTRR